MTIGLFEDRRDAGLRLAAALRGLPLVRPVVLAIPRGGVEIGAILAHELGAELDVVLSRKLRAPGQPELAIGAVCESGEVYLDPRTLPRTAAARAYVEEERAHQMEEIRRRAAMFRAARPMADVAGRSVIVTDDGLSTGSTMIAALMTLRSRGAREIIVAVPVAPPERLGEVRSRCDRIVCLETPEDFWAVGQFYVDFSQVPDERVVELLAGSAPPEATAAGPPARGRA